jgi:hypothetical protein
MTPRQILAVVVVVIWAAVILDSIIRPNTVSSNALSGANSVMVVVVMWVFATDAVRRHRNGR